MQITGKFGDGKSLAIAHWIDRYYKPDRLNALPGRRERIIEDRVQDVERSGWTLISRHDSMTGKAEVYGGSHGNQS